MAKRKSNLEKQVEVTIKKVNPITLIVAVFCLLVGVLGGWFGYKAITKNDTFELNGEKEITLNVGDAFVDEGAKIVAFGRDISQDVIIQGEVDTTKANEYVLTYTVNNFKYKGVKKIRIIRVVENNE